MFTPIRRTPRAARLHHPRGPQSAGVTTSLDSGRVVDDLQTRPWGDSDGQVIDRYGLHWLIGFEGNESE